MQDNNVILAEFEDESNAEIARRELVAAGIKTNIIKERIVNTSPTMLCYERVKLIVRDKQVEEAKIILAARFN
jgi:hypothetical protein